jgi:RNA-directed DNA polymerase
LQHALYRAAKADPGRRFHALQDKIYRRDVLWRAWVTVQRNGGAPGIDKTSLADVEEYGVVRLLGELAIELREGRYRPLPLRRVFIPKPGTVEQRPPSIPAVRDRIVQVACKIVLEPVFEADMLPCSFGFRPRRAAHDALQVLVDEPWRGRRWVVETDIANCFSAIPREKLMQAVEERVCDQAVLKLLRVILRAGVMSEGMVRREVTGAPQGAPMSPMLCNVYLHRLDRVWNTREHGVLVRYCDDLVVMCHSRQQAEAALTALRALLAELGLEPKEAKTCIVHGFDGARRGNEVGNLPLSVAGSAPCFDVGFRRPLNAVFYSANFTEVAAKGDRQVSRRETRPFADLTKADPQRRAGLLGWASRSGIHCRESTTDSLPRNVRRIAAPL